MSESSLFEISPQGMPPYAIRGATEVLEPIDASKQYRRTINGALVNLGHEQFEKFKLTLSCTDQQVPAFDGIWPGQTVIVHTITELCYPTIGGAISRYPVSGSIRVEGDYTFYRPMLTMLVTAFNTQRDEYSGDVAWSLELEEI